MRRRQFLLGVGAVGSLGTAGLGALALDGGVDVRVWFSERAAAHDDVEERVTGYLERALVDAAGDATVRVGGTVAVSTQNAYRLMTGTEWPVTVATRVGPGGPSPADDANLLVTDGDMDHAPTGAGVPYLAAVGGAAALSRLPPVEDADPVQPHSPRVRVAQVLLHECGHALGLGHDHGTVTPTADGERTVVSPMVSAYAWAPDHVREEFFGATESACGSSYPVVSKRNALLSLLYSECAADGLRRSPASLLR